MTVGSEPFSIFNGFQLRGSGCQRWAKQKTVETGFFEDEFI